MEATGDGDPTSSGGNGFVKTIPIIRDLTLNPSCSHGPTILFDRNSDRFFACSAYRSRKLCPFYMPEREWKSVADKKDKCRDKVADADDTGEGSPGRKKLRFTQSMESTRNAGEEDDVRKQQLIHPFNLPNQRDKGEAQYHFNDSTVQFFMTQLKNLEIDSILCVGTPSLYEHVESSNVGAGQNLRAFLLDIDQRFAKLYKGRFCLYNMCNHHFFEDQESSKYTDFLSQSRKLAVIVDPPFGVKVELIWHGCLMGVQKDLTRLRDNCSNSNVVSSNKDLHFEAFWIFPYFMEGHILKCSESMLQMSDFHVEYRNHAKYNGSTMKSKSSPIRIFTSTPLSNLILPENIYRYCEHCKKWVDQKNKHCAACNMCTTKDGGGTYIHCKRCKKCVKPTWKHCNKCSSCHLLDSACKKIIQGSHHSNIKDAAVIHNSKANNAKISSFISARDRVNIVSTKKYDNKFNNVKHMKQRKRNKQ